MAQQPLEMRRERQERKAAHQEANEAAMAEEEEALAELEEFAALDPDEKAARTAEASRASKVEFGKIQTKAMDVSAMEDKALSADDLESKTKDELKAMADALGIEVTRKKGKGEPLKADYVRALGG